MRSNRMKSVAFLAALMLCACSSSDSPPNGDGGLVPDAGADAGLDAGLDASVDAGMDASLDARIIFVTAARSNAALGGFDGADALCASEAADAGLAGEFRAWLSTLEVAAADRLMQSSVPYERVDGTRIADDWDDLTDGSLQAIINLDASGLERGGDVWTGTLPDGLPYADSDCDGFTSGTVGVALCGTTQSVNANWTANQVPACNTVLRLFCLQQ